MRCRCRCCAQSPFARGACGDDRQAPSNRWKGAPGWQAGRCPGAARWEAAAHAACLCLAPLDRKKDLVVERHLTKKKSRDVRARLETVGWVVAIVGSARSSKSRTINPEQFPSPTNTSRTKIIWHCQSRPRPAAAGRRRTIINVPGRSCRAVLASLQHAMRGAMHLPRSVISRGYASIEIHHFFLSTRNGFLLF